VNDVEGDFFLTGKGLTQGDPFAPLLFNFVVDVFSKMVNKGASCGMITGLCPHLVPGGVISLQYADDTLLFLEGLSLVISGKLGMVGLLDSGRILCLEMLPYPLSTGTSTLWLINK
jgi:hypothetical protein